LRQSGRITPQSTGRRRFAPPPVIVVVRASAGVASYKRVDDALARGELWRAKEILRGRVASSHFDPVLFERYGEVLLAAADLFEAGKFLFLSPFRERRQKCTSHSPQSQS